MSSDCSLCLWDTSGLTLVPAFLNLVDVISLLFWVAFSGLSFETFSEALREEAAEVIVLGGL